MRRFISRLAVVATALVVILTFTACGTEGGNPTGVITPPPPPPTVTLKSVNVSLDTTLTAGTANPYRVVAEYSDNTTKDVSALAIVSTSAEFYAAIDDVKVRALRLGSSQISASWGGMTSSVLVKVVGTPWSQLPAISAEAKAYLISNFAGDGHIVGFADGPKTLFVGEGINSANAMTAAKYWWPNDPVSFTADSAHASAVFTTKNAMPCATSDALGCGGPVDGVYNVLTRGLAYIRPDQKDNLAVYIHEMGHLVGWIVHTDEPGPISNVSGGYQVVVTDGPKLAEARAWKKKVGNPALIPIG